MAIPEKATGERGGFRQCPDRVTPKLPCEAVPAGEAVRGNSCPVKA